MERKQANLEKMVGNFKLSRGKKIAIGLIIAGASLLGVNKADAHCGSCRGQRHSSFRSQYHPRRHYGSYYSPMYQRYRSYRSYCSPNEVRIVIAVPKYQYYRSNDNCR